MKGTHLLVLLLSGCLQLRPYDHDPLEISARYQYKYPEKCAAWLRSPTTGYLYCSSPPFTVTPVLPKAPAAAGAGGGAAAKDGPTDQASLVANGEKVYTSVCLPCHGAEGKGTPGAFPPIAGSGGFYGDPKNHATIIVKGLSGAIEVQGVAFNGVMPPQGHLSDYEIASVATFERTSWGNADGVVLPADVAAVR